MNIITLSIAGFITLLLSSCYAFKDNLNREISNDEQIEIAMKADDVKLWQTDDLSIHYYLSDNENFFTLSGFVTVSDRVKYSFPRADFLVLYVYLLKSDGTAVRKHTIYLNISRLNSFPDQVEFSERIIKDSGATSFAFGYFGNFIDTDNERRGGRTGFDNMSWEIYHSPFE